jgi:putative DNA primase/helicase
VIEQGRAKDIICKNAGISKTAYTSIVNTIKEQLIEDLGRILASKTLETQYHNRKGLIHNGQFWAYNGKFWEPTSPELVGRNVLKVLDQMLKQLDINVKHSTIMGEAVKLMSSIAAKSGDPLGLTKEPKPIVNCQNGELWIDDKGDVNLKPHRPSSRLLQILDASYSPLAECPMFDKALAEIFGNFIDGEDMVRHFEEYMGYCLYPVKHKPYFWLFIGKGGDGKTTLLSVLGNLLGKMAKQPIKLDNFKSSGDNHAFDQIVGKLMVYQEDLEYGYNFPSGVVKDLCQSGDETANPKGTKAYQFKKVCTVTMTSNSYPKNKDFTEGFRRRAMVIPFDGGFHKRDSIIYNLTEKITEKELAGVLNRALQGLTRLRERGDFDVPDSCQIGVDDWLTESNHIMRFLKERLIITDKQIDRVKSVDLYNEFLYFCKDKNIHRIPLKDSVIGMLKDSGLHYCSIGNNNMGFRFLKIKDDFEITDDFEDL